MGRPPNGRYPLCLDKPGSAPRKIGHARQVPPPVLAAVVPEDGINEPRMEPAEGPGVLSADPAVVFLHALHVLGENDPDQLVDEFVGAIVKEIRRIRRIPLSSPGRRISSEYPEGA